MRTECKAVAGIPIYGRELVPISRGNSVQRHFTVAAALHFPQIIYRLMVQNQLAIAVKLAPFTVFAGDRFHLLTPFLWGMWWFSPFPPIERMESLWLPAKRLLFSFF